MVEEAHVQLSHCMQQSRIIQLTYCNFCNAVEISKLYQH